MFIRIGFTCLLLFLISTVLSLCATDSEARMFRRRATPAHYNTKPSNAQAGVVPHTTAKPIIPEQNPANSGQQDSKSSEKSATKAAAQLKSPAAQPIQPTHRGFSEYELLGLDFSPLIKTLPDAERQVLQPIAENYKPNYAGNIQKKYPEVRPEVSQCLAKIAEAVHQEKSREEIGAIIREMPLSTRQLQAKEVLAINQELAPAIDPEEFRAIDELNQFRMRCGLGPCVIDLLLCLVSRGHSSDMMRFGFFSHTSPVRGKSHFTMRAGQMGANASAENIYMGATSGNAASDAWEHSSGHRANMLGGFSRVGVGRAGGFFTQMFGH